MTPYLKPEACTAAVRGPILGAVLSWENSGDCVNNVCRSALLMLSSPVNISHE